MNSQGHRPLANTSKGLRGSRTTHIPFSHGDIWRTKRKHSYTHLPPWSLNWHTWEKKFKWTGHMGSTDQHCWCWERLKAGGEGDDSGWDGWMASPTRWTWVWATSGSWWWTGKPGVLQSMGSKEVDTTEWLKWTDQQCQWDPRPEHHNRVWFPAQQSRKTMPTRDPLLGSRQSCGQMQGQKTEVHLESSGRWLRGGDACLERKR